VRAVQERRAVAPVAPSRRGHAVRPLALVTAVVVIAIDHATKWWAINALDERDIDLIGSLREGSGLLGGAVVDFIDVQFWPVWNVADMGIFGGALALALTAGRDRDP